MREAQDQIAGASSELANKLLQYKNVEEQAGGQEKKKCPKWDPGCWTGIAGVIAKVTPLSGISGCFHDPGINLDCAELTPGPGGKGAKWGLKGGKWIYGKWGKKEVEKEVEKAAGKGRRLSDCKCFLVGTKVLMGDRSSRNIEALKVGDQVLATHPLTGRTVPRQVTRTIVTDSDKRFNELTITTPNGPARLTATHEHPFWAPDKHRWLPARELSPGTTLRTSDGTTARVKANRAYDDHARTYNLTVDNLHTYYVLAGKTPVLVHNSNCPVPISKGRWDHIWDRHVVRGGEFPNKSKFLTTSKAKIRKMVNRALEVRPATERTATSSRIRSAGTGLEMISTTFGLWFVIAN
ncbi:hypothetical protein H7K43_23760 [Streptomyces sp. TYQ1024]|nr:hypothetical protein [Streptomyces sp. TYQ1024]